MRNPGLLRVAILGASLIFHAASIGAALGAQQTQGAMPTVQAPLASGNDAHICPQPNAPGIRPMRWGYYPGYGCGPVPRAQTVYP